MMSRKLFLLFFILISHQSFSQNNEGEIEDAQIGRTKSGKMEKAVLADMETATMETNTIRVDRSYGKVSWPEGPRVEQY